MRQTHRPERPSSAKRRTQPGLGDTLRPGEANKWMKTTKPRHESPPPVKGATTYESPRFSKQPSQSELDNMFGNTTKSRASPKDSLYSQSRKSPIDEDSYGRSRASPKESMFPQPRKSPVMEDPYGKGRASPKESLFPQARKSPVEEERYDKYDKYGKQRASPKDSLFGQSRKSPVDEEAYGKRGSQSTSGTSLPKSLFGGSGRKSPTAQDRKSPLTKEQMKEELIYGRKTPTKD